MRKRGLRDKVKGRSGKCWYMSRQTEVGLEKNRRAFFPVSHPMKCAVGESPSLTWMVVI